MSDIINLEPNAEGVYVPTSIPDPKPGVQSLWIPLIDPARENLRFVHRFLMEQGEPVPPKDVLFAGVVLANVMAQMRKAIEGSQARIVTPVVQLVTEK